MDSNSEKVPFIGFRLCWGVCFSTPCRKVNRFQNSPLLCEMTTGRKGIGFLAAGLAGQPPPPSTSMGPLIDIEISEQ